MDMNDYLNSLGLNVRTIAPLSGGLTNRCFKIETNQGAFVWRPMSTQAAILGADRNKERQILQALHNETFAPTIYHFDQYGLLLEWFDGDTLSGENTRNIVIDLLVSIHQIAIVHFSPDLKDNVMNLSLRIQAYWSQLSPHNKTPELQRYVEYFSRQSSQPLLPICLCHYDAGAYNVITTTKGYGLIDWEYASIGDPSQDLAAVIIANQYDAESVIKRYCELQNLSEERWQQAVRNWLPWFSFISVLWFHLGHQLYQDECYQKQAEDEMNRLIKLLSLK